MSSPQPQFTSKAILRSVIEPLWKKTALAAGLDDDTLAEAVDASSASLSEQYYNPPIDIDFTEPIARLAYLRTYALARADLMYKSLCDSPNLKQALLDELESGRLSVAGLGAGPGSELVGIATFLVRECPQALPANISFTHFDLEPSWSDEVQDVAQAITNLSTAVNNGDALTTTVVAHPIDLASRNTSTGHTLSGHRLYVMSSLLSSLSERQWPGLRDNIKDLRGIADEGTRFVVLERDHGGFRQKAEWVLTDGTSGFTIERFVAVSDQEVSRHELPVEFGPLSNKCDWVPQRKMSAIWCTAVKE